MIKVGDTVKIHMTKWTELDPDYIIATVQEVKDNTVICNTNNNLNFPYEAFIEDCEIININ